MPKAIYVYLSEGDKRKHRIVLSDEDAKRYVRMQPGNPGYIRRQFRETNDAPTYCYDKGRFVPVSFIQRAFM